MPQTLRRLAHRAFQLHPEERDARHQSLVMHGDTIQTAEHQGQVLENKLTARDLQAFRQTLISRP